MEEQECSRAKRQKTDKFGRFAALNKLKQLKGKGIKNKYEISEVENVYETVDEKEYSKKVYERQSDDWIVDDDGSGYIEDGRDIFDDDLDAESVMESASKSKSNKKKKVSKLLNNKGSNIQTMLSSMPEKKKKEVSVDDDDVLSELLGNIKESKTELKEHVSIIDEEKVAAKEYMKSLTIPKRIKANLQTSVLKVNHAKKTKNDKNEKPLNEIKNFSDEMMHENNSDNFILENKNAESDISFQSDKTYLKVKDNLSETTDTLDDSFASVDTIVNTDTNFEHENNFDDSHFDDDFDIGDLDIDKENLIKDTDNKSFETMEEEFIMSGWETMQDGTNSVADASITINTEELPYVTNSDGKQVFRFFWWDAHEDYFKKPGIVFLFGKVFVESSQAYASCCVAVRNIERKMYLLPRAFEMEDDLKTETNKRIKIIDVYNEFNDKISEKLGIKTFRSRKVTKKYVFDPNIPEESDYLEIRYSAKHNPLDAILEGKTFSKVFGTNTSFLEILLLDRKIKGPCWLDVINPQLVTVQNSYCKFEINCNSITDISVVDKLRNIPPPPMVAITLNIRTFVHPETKKSEIVMIGCVVNNQYCIDKKPPNPPFQQHFCALTKPSNQIFPLNFYESLQNYRGTKVQKCDSEKALLNYFISQIEKIDPDLIIGHDLIDYYFGLICSRIDATNVANWSRFGKLKRSKKLTNVREIRDLMIGHLVCDLKISAKELIKARSYDLDTLFEQVLNIKEERLTSNDVSRMFSNSNNIIKLISFTMEDAAHLTKIVHELNALPLALQITNIAGNVMSKTLLGGRSERNEYLLLHAFTEKGYIPPDKSFSKKRINKNKENVSNRKKPTYSGGLVLDPKVGFYDKYILLMDFNSLYPSIIQEYNICFTTIPNNIDIEQELTHNMDELGILPTEICKLVESRREVKKMMANPDLLPEVHMQYNIRQMALKLTANSMYGCLGFSNSRFYAKHLASLVTMKGRDILMNTKDLVQGMSLEVIYGDTDSIMINTNTTDYDQVIKIGSNIKQTVNKSYRQLELEIDGVFKFMLLLKKKKYAAVTMSKGKNGKIMLKEEYKGLDIVRRDWSQLASEVGKSVLSQILNDQTEDERLENIGTILNKIASDLRENKIPLSLLVITKQLSKDPSQYNEKNILPHVQVALRYNKSGIKPLTQGDTVPYVICNDGTNTAATNRAYHLEELKKSDHLKIDIDYYLSLQVHPVVSRLCEPIESLDAAQIANMLGLDPSAYKKLNQHKPQEQKTVQLAMVKESIKFVNTEVFIFKCPNCNEKNTIQPPSNNKLSLANCSNCKIKLIDYIDCIENCLSLEVRKFATKYYKSAMICEDPMCPNETEIVPLKFAGAYPVCDACNKGIMYSQYSEKEFYTQLKYYKYLFDLSKLEKTEHIDKTVVEAYKILKEYVDEQLQQCGYSVIQLEPLFKFCNFKEHAANLDNEENIDLYINENQQIEDDEEELVLY